MVWRQPKTKISSLLVAKAKDAQIMVVRTPPNGHMTRLEKEKQTAEIKKKIAILTASNTEPEISKSLAILPYSNQDQH
jgi:hypothetical protein